jgi:pentatricopeptide repeat protein
MNHEPDNKALSLSHRENQGPGRLPQHKGISERREGKAKDHQRHHRGFKDKFHKVNVTQSISTEFFLDLEKRSVHHRNSFPLDTVDSRALLKWNSATVQLVMEWTKLWGKNRGSNHVSSEQVSRGVSLANELMGKVLEMTHTEIGRALKRSKQLSEHPSPSVLIRNDRSRNSKELDIEICCQMIALGWSRCDPRTLPPREAAQKAQTILDRLEEIRQMFDRLPRSDTQKLSFKRQDVTPTTRLYNHVLTCWSRSLHPDAENQARRLLIRMASSNGTFSKPDTISYNNLLHLYANKGDFEKAEALLRQMEQTSVESHSSSTTLPIHQFPISHEITADVFSYSIVINALRKRFVSGGVNRDMDDPVRAEKILLQMVKNGVMPNDVCYSTVLSLYAVADRLMREELSNPKSRKWKNIGLVSNNIGWGAENAERVLDWMIDLYEREGQDGQGERVQINSQHFTTVIDAWAKAGKGVEGAKHCERLCDRLVSLYEKSGEDFLRPRPEVCTAPRSIMICLDYSNKVSSIIL